MTAAAKHRHDRSTNGPAMKGKVAVITGAGSGIGRATALLFARHGATVWAADLDANAAESVAQEITRAGGHALARGVDVRAAAAVETLASEVFATHDRVDVLMNNAGIGFAGPVEQTTLDDWDRVLGVNLHGVVHGVHAFVPSLLKQGHPACIINTASMLGLIAGAQLAPYCTSKFAVVGLSEALNAELAPRGIRVVALCPGVINTPIIEHTITRGAIADKLDNAREYYRTNGATAEDVARAALRATRSRRTVEIVPRTQVAPPWVVKRLSPRAAQVISRKMPNLLGAG